MCLCEGECINGWQHALREKCGVNGDCVWSSVHKNLYVGVSAVRACSVNEAARLLVFVCVCVCIRVYECVHTSHLHGAMPHRFHWGVREQRLSISSAAVPAGKSLIIIS